MDLPQITQGVRQRREGPRPLGEGVACGSAGLDRIGLLIAEDRGAVVLDALRIAAGDAQRPTSRRGELAQEVHQVVGILPGHIEADVERTESVALGERLEPSAELGVAVSGLGEGEFVGSGLQILLEEGGIVAVARGIDADAEARDA